MAEDLSGVRCPLCQARLRFSLASSRRAKNQKHFVMLVCPNDARHFRGFISDQTHVAKLIRATEGALSDPAGGGQR